jgi:hypothetical protein
LLSIVDAVPNHPDANTALAEYYETMPAENAAYAALAKKYRAQANSAAETP